MSTFFSPRVLFLSALAVLCCTSCSTPEERADAAFAELQGVVRHIGHCLGTVTDADSAQAAVSELEEQADALREVLCSLDALADNPDMPQEARRRVGERHHEMLQAETKATLNEVYRVAKHHFYHCDGLRRIARREGAHYSVRGVHLWARAVLAGREYHPKPERR